MTLVYPGSETLHVNGDTPPGSKPIVRPESIINVDELSYLIWDVADIDQQHEFFVDFGMLCVEKTDQTLMMRTYGDSPYVFVGRKAKKHKFVGLGFTAISREALVALAKDTNTGIETIDRIGGGEMVKLLDPMGNTIEVSFGIERAEFAPTRTDVLPVNTYSNITRVNEAQRSPLEPAPVLKLGHCVLSTNHFEETLQWYMRHLGIIPSDVLCMDDGSPIVSFSRLNRGDKPADHHSIAIAKGTGVGYMHSAYEVVDVDAVGQGQQYLKAKQKYKHAWGIGRHLLGSQLFDYWKDPVGYEFEHYADGDVYTSDHPTGYHPLDSGNIYSWGADLPKDFLAPKPRQVIALLGGLFDGSVTFAWLKKALKATSRPGRPWLK